MESRAGTEKGANVAETSQGKQVCDLHGVFPDRTSQTRAFVIRDHLPASRESKEPEISFQGSYTFDLLKFHDFP